MNELETYAIMLSDCHDPDRLRKIIGYIDADLEKIGKRIETLNRLKGIAEKRIEEAS